MFWGATEGASLSLSQSQGQEVTMSSVAAPGEVGKEEEEAAEKAEVRAGGEKG